MQSLTIRPLKHYRDNLNRTGRESQADTVQRVIELLQKRNRTHDESSIAALNTLAVSILRAEKIPYGGRSLQGEHTSYVTDGGRVGKRMRVARNFKSFGNRPVGNPYRGLKFDRGQYAKV